MRISTPIANDCKRGPACERNFAKLLDEGYFKSFPTKTVISDIESLLTSEGLETSDHPGSEEVDFFVEPESSKDELNDMDIVQVAVDAKVFDEDVQRKIEKRLRCDGWYVGDKVSTDDCVVLMCEPKFPIENSRVEKFSVGIIRQFKTFYHSTFKKYAKKIEADGLVPSMGAKLEFKHPERVYLFGNVAMAWQFSKMPLTDDVLSVLVRKDRVTGWEALKKFQNPSDFDPVIFEVDLDACLKDGKCINLYHDNRWDSSSPAFFTFNSISPRYLNKL